jgi:hypothetical protein
MLYTETKMIARSWRNMHVHASYYRSKIRSYGNSKLRNFRVPAYGYIAFHISRRKCVNGKICYIKVTKCHVSCALPTDRFYLVFFCVHQVVKGSLQLYMLHRYSRANCWKTQTLTTTNSSWLLCGFNFPQVVPETCTTCTVLWSRTFQTAFRQYPKATRLLCSHYWGNLRYGLSLASFGKSWL